MTFRSVGSCEFPEDCPELYKTPSGSPITATKLSPTAQFMANATKAGCSAPKCLNQDWLRNLGLVLFGSKPADVSPGIWANFVNQMHACGWDTLLACPDITPSAASVPSCWTPEQLNYIGKALTYCQTYPHNDGPDTAANQGCWQMSRYGDYYKAAIAVQPCASSVPPGHLPEAAPESTPAPVVAADTTAAPVQSSVTSNYALWGLLGAAAIVGGYMVWKKK